MLSAIIINPVHKIVKIFPQMEGVSNESLTSWATMEGRPYAITLQEFVWSVKRKFDPIVGALKIYVDLHKENI